MTKKRSNKKSRNKYKVSGGVGGGRGGRGLTNNKKTRPLGGRRRRNRSQNQEGGMKYRTMLEKDSAIAVMGSTLSSIIPRLFAGLYASWKARHPEAAEVGQDYTYADIGGSLTNKGGNKFILKTRAGLEPNHTKNVLNEYVMYSDWYVYELQPTPDEITAYKKMSGPSTKEVDNQFIDAVWKGNLTKFVWRGQLDTVDQMLKIINGQYRDPDLMSKFIGPVAYSIITSTTLSRYNVPDIKNASHTLLYTACRSPNVTPDMIIMLIRHGCNVNQPNGAVRFTHERDSDWASGANLTPLWGLVKCIIDNNPPAQSEFENRIFQCLEILIRQGANTCWRNTDAQTISEYIAYHNPTISSDRLNQKISQIKCDDEGKMLEKWTTIDKRTSRNIQYYMHEDGGTTYQRPVKALNLSLIPTADADAAAKAVAAAAADATAAAAAAHAGPAAKAASASVVAVEAPGKWKWETDDGAEWKDYSPGVNAALDTARTHGYRYIIIDAIPNATWLFSMKAKTQANIVSNSRRVIQRDPDVGMSEIVEPFDGIDVKWYIDTKQMAGDISSMIEVEYQKNRTNVAVKIRDGTYNFSTLKMTSGGKDGTEYALTRVCFNPSDSTINATAAAAKAAAAKAPKLTAVTAAAAPAKAAAAAAAAATGAMSVDDFCAMAYTDNADDNIIKALNEGRLTRDDGVVKSVQGNGNTALYCACRSPKTTVASISRILNASYIKNVNKPNDNSNGSTPLHGLVERLRAPGSNVPDIIEIMKLLVKRSDRTLANNVVNGGTALQEFNRFNPDEIRRLQGQEAEIITLLTPTAADIVAAAKLAISTLRTSAQDPDLEGVIRTHYNTSVEPLKPSRGKDGNRTWGPYINAVMEDLHKNPITFDKAVLQELRATTVGDIEKEYLRFVELANLLAAAAPPPKASFTIVGPFIDGKYALKSNLARNSIVQVASQFDFLESASSDYVPISAYPYDHTQGPGSSMASLEALILRDAAIKPIASGGELQKLGQQPIFTDIPWYKNGYLEPHKELNQVKLLKTAKLITDNIGSLKILAQESIPEFGKFPCIQVFSAAPSYQSYHNEKGHYVHVPAPAEDSAGAQICDVLVLAQYMSIARLAVIKSIAEPSKPINLHLTGVGQGAFNNPPSLYNKFITAVWKIVRPFNISVYMHVYGDPDGWDENNSVFINRVTALNTLFTEIDSSAKTASGGSKLPQLTAEEFIKHV